MYPIVINNVYNNYYFQSKYNTISLNNYSQIIKLTFRTLVYLKRKNKFFLFLKILHLLMFNNKSNSFFIFKNTNINFITTVLTSKSQIFIFLHHYVNVYLPLIDSFFVDSKILFKKELITLSFFKFPLFFELNIIFSSIEYLLSFLNSYKYQLEFLLTIQKNKRKNIVFLQSLKIPLLF